jgi:hypothetical protein
VAEHESDREGREPDEQNPPFDEDAAWRAIVAGYGEEPPDPPGAAPFRPVEDLALPEPPPLPNADTTAKFAWLGVVGGPVLVLLAMLLGWDMTWWLTTLSVGGFLGGFATLVMRMRTDDDEEDDPGRGAVV